MTNSYFFSLMKYTSRNLYNIVFSPSFVTVATHHLSPLGPPCFSSFCLSVCTASNLYLLSISISDWSSCPMYRHTVQYITVRWQIYWCCLQICCLHIYVPAYYPISQFQPTVQYLNSSLLSRVTYLSSSLLFHTSVPANFPVSQFQPTFPYLNSSLLS